MAESTVTLTAVDVWHDSKRIHVVGTIAIGASPGTYSTGGVALNPLTKLASQVPGAARLVKMSVEGIAGIKYEFDKANSKLIMRSSAAYAPTFTVKTGTIGSNMTTGLTADAATASFVGGTGITADRSLTTNNPVGALAAAALAELASAAMPASVSGDTITFEAILALV